MNKPIKRSWQTMRTDDLDAIATYAGILAAVAKHLEDTLMMPYFSPELERIAEKAFNELERRGQRAKEGITSCNTKS